MTSTNTLAASGAPLASEEQSLLGRLENFLGARYPAFVAAVAVALFLLLVLAVQLSGGPADSVRSRLWTSSLDPVMTVYILAVHPLMHRRWRRAIDSLRALAPHVGEAARLDPASRRREWGAMLVGALLGVTVARHLPGVEGWLRLYSEGTSALTFALLAAAIYGSVARSRHLAAHSRAALELNVFDAHLLTPFARWGQSLTLVFVGGICLSLLFQSSESLRSIEGVLVYGSLIVVSLTLFFTSMWTIHAALARAQAKELARVRVDLAAAREALMQQRACEPPGSTHQAYAAVVVLGMYERQVLDAPTWPFNPSIVGRVFASAAAPLGVYVVKAALGMGGVS